MTSLFRNKFVRGVTAISSATVLGQAVLLLGMPLLTRLYGTQEFGVLGIFSSILAVLLVSSSLRYDVAIPIPKRDESAFQLTVLASLINIVVAVIVAIAVAFFHEEIAQVIGHEALGPYLWMLPVGLMLAGFYRIFTYWAVRKGNYNVVARTKVTQSILGVGVQSLWAFFNPSAAGLIGGQIVARAAGTRVLARDFRIYRIQKKRLYALLRKHKRFPIYDAPAALLNGFSHELPQILLSTLFGPVVAGHYFLAQRVLGAPSALVGQAVAQVLYGQSVEAKDRKKLSRLTIRVSCTLFFLIIGPTLILMIWGPSLFQTIFGANWQEAGVISRIIVLGVAAQFIYSPISTILILTDAQHLNLLLQILSIILRGASLLFGWFVNDLHTALYAFTISSMIVYGLGILVVNIRAISSDRRSFG
jgi:O-antigen/teichoic acid export membrane protein